MVTNSVINSFYGCVKIQRIEMWSPPAAQGSAVTCSVDWVGNANSPNREFSDTTVSVSTPAYVVTSPPPQSLASFWQTNNTNALATLTAPSGTIIDVVLALILNDSDEATAQNAAATVVLGNIYYLSLDLNATHRYVPVSLTTTT